MIHRLLTVLAALALTVPCVAGETLLTLKIPSLSCEGCRATVEGVVAEVHGARAVDVNLETKIVRVYLSESSPKLTRTLIEALAKEKKKATVESTQPFEGVRGVPASRVARLASGVNLCHWLVIPKDPGEAAFRAYITEQDLKRLKDLGMTHVRLPIEPDLLWDPTAHALRPDGLARLRHALGLIAAADLAVVVEAHPATTTWITPDEQGYYLELEKFWNALATELAGTDPERVFFELLNEPHDLKKPEQWPAAQTSLLLSVRAGAPDHTIILTGPEWSNISGLVTQKAGLTANVVYTFHFYEPHLFTHQGATWGWPGWRHIQGLEYPVSDANIKSLTTSIKDPEALGAVRQYAKEVWTADRLRGRIAAAAEWAKANNVAVYCGEFGVYREYSPASSRVAWLTDVAAALREHAIGWAAWDYAGGFGLVQGEPGSRTLDDAAARALGLRTSGTP